MANDNRGRERRAVLAVRPVAAPALARAPTAIDLAGVLHARNSVRSSGAHDGPVNSDSTAADTNWTRARRSDR